MSKLSEGVTAKSQDSTPVENTAPARTRSKRKPTNTANKRVNKRKSPDSSDDELLMEVTSSAAIDTSRQSSHDNYLANDDLDDIESTINNTPKSRRDSASTTQTCIGPITDYDRIITSTLDVADHYMTVANETCRFNAVFFVCKFLSHVETLGVDVVNALKATLLKRMRDRKPMIRAQAVLASRTFQENKATQEAFSYHFQYDPELVVRKALFQIMDTDVFGYEFLVASTRDVHETMRKTAFKRLGSISPSVLTLEQIHRVLHNGLNERERQVSYAFKNHTLESWLKTLYDGLDLCKLLESFDILNHFEDVARLLEFVYEKDLEQIENNGAATKLHHVVETFRDKWLSSENSCLPSLNQIDERVTAIWFTLVKFCKTNQSIIKSVRVRSLPQQQDDPNESLEKILESQEPPNQNDELVELYERLTPDLVNLVDFLSRFAQHASQILKSKEGEKIKFEFIYQQIMQFTLTYEVGDDVECKTVKEVLSLMLKENLLTEYFENYIPPIVKCLRTLIYSKNPNLIINYISDSITNIRSHLEDIASSNQNQFTTPLKQSRIPRASAFTSSVSTVKKVRISETPRLATYMNEAESQKLEYKMCTIRVDLEELKDKLEVCVKLKDFDQAKTINSRISDLQAELASLRDRRRSMASDVSCMSIDSDPNKLSSTMIDDTSMDDSLASCQANKDDLRIFRDHTNDLIKCLHMYYSCLQNVQVKEVPPTMLNHLNYLTFECLDEYFRDDGRVRSLMVSCHGLTAVMDKTHSQDSSTRTLILASCNDPSSILVRTAGFRSLVDVLCQYEDIEFPMDTVEKLFHNSLREYGKYNPEKIDKNDFNFLSAVVEGASKLYYFKRIWSPKILSHMILWWYHPRTHSKLKQFIGVFLPLFVAHHVKKQQQQVQNDEESDAQEEDTWLRDLLKETFLLSVEFLHTYILGPGLNIMAASDMHNLINFLCNLTPRQFHADIKDRLDDRIDELSNKSPDLVKYLKQAKTSLASSLNNLDLVEVERPPEEAE